jgi:tRNA-2-methylthio-N6-dimethylallyladenosine synthase
MIRRYSVGEYLERVAALRAAVPEMTLSTDVIVGFPGETREDFGQTLRLVETVRYSGLFGFMYSERPYTPAEKLDDDVSDADKSARLAELFELSGAIRRQHLESLVGSVQAVLVEGRGKTGRFTGRSEKNEIVHFDAAGELTGEIVDVRIVRAFKNSLDAEPVDESRRLAPRSNTEPLRRALPVL